MDDLVALVRRSLGEEARAEFERRVDEQAATLIEHLQSGDLDNADAAVGLELECYLVDGDGRLAPLDKGAFDDAPVARELGLHNVEVNTPATVFDDAGVGAQAAAIRERFDAAADAAGDADVSPVLDAMWTIPPSAGTRAYLGATSTVDDVVVAENMTDSPRYYALDNAILRDAGGEIALDLPCADLAFPSILVESLTTSIQPHLQVPRAAEFPEYYSVAIRTLGPVLALATNSPLLPADCYAGVDPDRLLADTHHELRVPVFEQSINAGREPGKVRFPDDIEEPADAVRDVVADRTVAPFLREWVEDGDAESFRDSFWELDHKHGTYWRWLRPVIGGDAIDADNTVRSLRIEYRPLPTQPSVRDVVGLQCLVSGLIHGLVAADHPLGRLDWSAARRSFYDAVADGPAADLQWVTADGERTTDRTAIYDEIFEFARRGLRDQSVRQEAVERYVGAIEARRETAPSAWKLDRVREGLDDGLDLDAAIRRMQRAYIENTRTPFAEWD